MLYIDPWKQDTQCTYHPDNSKQCSKWAEFKVSETTSGPGHGFQTLGYFCEKHLPEKFDPELQKIENFLEKADELGLQVDRDNSGQLIIFTGVKRLFIKNKRKLSWLTDTDVEDKGE